MVYELQSFRIGSAGGARSLVQLGRGPRALCQRYVRSASTGQGGVIMPTYEYYCQNCDRTFDRHLSLEERDSESIECPHCKKTNVEQLLTPFVAVTSKKS
jgi:putative FmdB family regulatory protein